MKRQEFGFLLNPGDTGSKSNARVGFVKGSSPGSNEGVAGNNE